MPNIQIRGSQIQGESVEPSNINLSGSFDFRAATGFQVLTKPEAENSTFPASTAFVHTMVSGSIIDGFQGGNGISIDVSTSPDTIAVDLATNPGLQFSSNKLDVKVKTETGGTISKDADGIYIGDSAIGNAKLAGSIANAKLANSTISGVALGSNLASLSAGNGISMSSYNGSAAVNNLTLNLDGSTLSVGASGVKISDLGVATGQLANLAVSTGKIADTAVSTAKLANSAVDSSKLADDAVSTAKIADAAVDPSKLSFQAQSDTFSPNGSTLAFNLSQEVNGNFDQFVMAFKNGLLQRLVASSPGNADEYTVSTAGGTTTITFGANLNANDELEVRYLA